MADRGLTPKQQKFVEEYLKNYHVTNAAIAAGYSKKSAYSMGSQLLKNIKVRAAINEARAKSFDKNKLTPERILADIAIIKERCMQGVEVKDAKGNPTGEWKFEPYAAIKCCEFEANYIGMLNGPGSDKENPDSYTGRVLSALRRRIKR